MTDARPTPSQALPHISLRDLVLTHLRIGALAFGGLGAALALLQREFVDRRKVLTAADVTEALTYTKLLPGSTVLQVVSYLGYRMGGWRGSAVATAAFLLPSVTAMLLVAGVFVSAAGLPSVALALRGLTVAVAGILVATTFRLGKANVTGITGCMIALLAIVATTLGVNAGAIVVVSGLIGVIVFREPAARTVHRPGQEP